MNNIVKELRETNAAARDLRAANIQLQQLLLLDEMLCKAELEVGLLDGVPISAEKNSAE